MTIAISSTIGGFFRQTNNKMLFGILIHIPVNEIIYLRTTPSIAMERLLQRKRHEERNVTLEYLEELHKLHEEWLMDRTCDDLDIVLITVI